jgi:hypothetical protein
MEELAWLVREKGREVQGRCYKLIKKEMRPLGQSGPHKLPEHPNIEKQ